jgi:SAM-dependent methyltransferase
MSLIKHFKRNVKDVIWGNLRNIKPISEKFGLDRGTPVDRYYIEKFLYDNRNLINGKILEVAEDTYSKKYGDNIESIDILHFDKSNKKATIIGDLTKAETLPGNKFDCFICTQTLNFIYDFNSAIQGIKKVLKPQGHSLITLAGLCQISRYDSDRWGDYWRFTTDSASKIFKETFGEKNITVKSFGNVLSAVTLLEGISFEELTTNELDHNDENYQVIITVLAKKEA